jgi:multidrug resistance efflux pump
MLKVLSDRPATGERRTFGAVMFLVLAALISWQTAAVAPGTPRARVVEPHAVETGATAKSASATLELPAKTQPAQGRQARLTPIVVHPVIAVLAAPADRVKAGQKLIVMDADEPEANVRGKKAAVAELEASLSRVKALPRTEERAKARAELEAAQATAQGAAEHLNRLTPLLEKGALAPGQELQARTAAMHAEANRKAAAAYLEYLLKQPIAHEIAEIEARLGTAKAELDASEAELEHYALFAPIDGVISWLDAPLGTAARPGTAIWGEIVDLREIDARCEVTPEQADHLDRDKPAELIWPGSDLTCWTGRVVFVGPVANARTGLVAVLARFNNPQERLRANVTVQLRLPLKSPATAIISPPQAKAR